VSNVAKSQQYVTFYKKPRKNRDGSASILTLVRVPKFKRFSKTFATMEEAEAWALPLAKELAEQGERGGIRPSLSTLTITQLVNQYLDDPKTEELESYEDYAARADWWKEHYGSMKVLDFNVPVLYEAREKLKSTGHRQGGRSPATINRHLAVMRLIWNWGRSAGWVPQDKHWPTRLLLKEPRGRDRFLLDDELVRLLKAAEADPLMRAAILVSIATGVRRGELARFKWADLDLVTGRVTTMKTKNGSPRTVYLPPQAVSALETLKGAKVVSPVWVFMMEDGQPLTKGELTLRWRRIRATSGIKNFKWHDPRHTTASYLAQGGSTLLEIGSVLGHKSYTTTLRYAHLVQGAPVKGHAALDAKLKG
jgi:integrase